MVTDAFSDDRGLASPRISFSRNLSLSDLAPLIPDERRTDASPPVDIVGAASEFDFSISIEISAEDPSPADDIFSDGKILPLPIKISSTLITSPPLPQPEKPNHPSPPTPILERKGSLREIMDADGGTNKRSDGSRQSFWRFGRSSSAGHSRKTGLPCPFQLALPRSKSTGSYLNPNQNPIQKPRRNSSSIRNINSPWFRKASTDSDWKGSYYYPRGNRNSGGNGIRISPVLNVPAPLIPRSGSGSGGGSSSSSSSVLAYLLCNCKDKNMERSEVCSSP